MTEKPMTKKEAAKFGNICHPKTCPTCKGFDTIERKGKWIACTNKTWCKAKSTEYFDGWPVGTHHCGRRKHKTGYHRSGNFEW